jgi:hypothetical protein
MKSRASEDVKALSMVKMHGKDDAIKHATQCMYMANQDGYEYWKKVISIIETL